MSHSALDPLLRRAAKGDASAWQELVALHRDRLRRMVTVRMDARVQPRVDPSDVVQDALWEASRKLPDYVHQPPVSFYPWLRKITWECLIRTHRMHLDAGKRTVRRELDDINLSDDSILGIAQVAASPHTSVYRAMVRQEMICRIRQVLDRMKPPDREVLVMKYLEQLTSREIAESLEISEAAVKMRHARALQRLQRTLADVQGGLGGSGPSL